MGTVCRQRLTTYRQTRIGQYTDLRVWSLDDDLFTFDGARVCQLQLCFPSGHLDVDRARLVLHREALDRGIFESDCPRALVEQVASEPYLLIFNPALTLIALRGGAELINCLKVWRRMSEDKLLLVR